MQLFYKISEYCVKWQLTAKIVKVNCSTPNHARFPWPKIKTYWILQALERCLVTTRRHIYPPGHCWLLQFSFLVGKPGQCRPPSPGPGQSHIRLYSCNPGPHVLLQLPKGSHWHHPKMGEWGITSSIEIDEEWDFKVGKFKKLWTLDKLDSWIKWPFLVPYLSKYPNKYENSWNENHWVLIRWNLVKFTNS